MKLELLAGLWPGIAGLLVVGFFVWQLVRIGMWLEDREQTGLELEAGFCRCGDCLEERSSA